MTSKDIQQNFQKENLYPNKKYLIENTDEGIVISIRDEHHLNKLPLIKVNEGITALSNDEHQLKA